MVKRRLFHIRTHTHTHTHVTHNNALILRTTIRHIEQHTHTHTLLQRLYYNVDYCIKGVLEHKIGNEKKEMSNTTFSCTKTCSNIIITNILYTHVPACCALEHVHVLYKVNVIIILLNYHKIPCHFCTYMYMYDHQYMKQLPLLKRVLPKYMCCMHTR